MSRVLDLWAGMTGTVLDFAGSTAPTGWLLCYGQAVSRTTYASLFTAIGTTFGAGDGSTTFNVPDCRGRVHAGKDDMGGSAASRITASGSGITGTTLGAAGGSETHTMTTAEMPNHTHANTLTDPGHVHSNTLSDPGHTHSHNALVQNASSSTGGGGFSIPANGGATINAAATGITINNASKVTGITITNAAQGSGTPHNITQPTLVLNKIIKT